MKFGIMCKCLIVESAVESASPRLGLLIIAGECTKSLLRRKRLNAMLVKWSSRRYQSRRTMQKCVVVRYPAPRVALCVCGSEYSKSYIARHRRACVGWQNRNQQPAATAAAAAPAPRGPCPNCGAVMRKDNIARHGRTACPGSVAGP